MSIRKKTVTVAGAGVVDLGPATLGSMNVTTSGTGGTLGYRDPVSNAFTAYADGVMVASEAKVVDCGSGTLLAFQASGAGAVTVSEV
jgi:hypothetical protein